MKTRSIISLLVLVTALLAFVATTIGLFSSQGPGPYPYTSIRDQTVMLYGKGIYQHMSATVAIQGIAQDFITLCVGIPLLFISHYWTGKNKVKGRFLLAGTSGYFLVTYFFYLTMSMYNVLFLVYVSLTATSFFLFIHTLMSLNKRFLKAYFHENLPVRFLGGFLIFNAVAIGLLWLSVIVPPLFRGTIIPLEVEHYTTLIVQGVDLSLLLPAAFISGWLLLRRKPLGYLLGPVYLIFLSILMTALTTKIVAMAFLGLPVFPAVVIIPVFNLTAILCGVIIMRNLKENEPGEIRQLHSIV